MVDLDQVRKRRREWYAKTRDRRREYQKEYHSKHREEENKKARERYARKHEEYKAKAFERYHKNIGRHRAYGRESYYRHKAEINRRRVEQQRLRRLEIIKLLGGKCPKCEFSDVRALQIDHVNGGGKKDIVSGHGHAYLLKVRKSVEAGEHKYQLLCANCNWIKNHEENKFVSYKL